MGTWYGKLGRVVAYLAVASTLSAGCGGDSDDDQAPPVTSAGIGPMGGVVSAPSGAQINVPAGALDSTVTLSISVAMDAPELPSAVAALGDVYALTPHGQEFMKPVTIRIPFSGGDNPELYTAPDGGSWSRITGATRSGAVMSANVEHFSFFVVVEALKAGTGGSGNSAGSPAMGEGGSNAQAGSGSEGGSTSLGGGDSGGASAQGGSGNDGGASQTGGASGAGGASACVCGADGEPCCADADSVPLGNCAFGNGSCDLGNVCTTPGICSAILP